jgi:hypothetical protein
VKPMMELERLLLKKDRATSETSLLRRWVSRDKNGRPRELSSLALRCGRHAPTPASSRAWPTRPKVAPFYPPREHFNPV